MADQGSYYVPEQSKLPLLAALGMGIMGYGAATWVIDGQSSTTFAVGLVLLAIVMFKWWSLVIEENTSGIVSDQLKYSYVLGMYWFIFSELMFFICFFCLELNIRKKINIIKIIPRKKSVNLKKKYSLIQLFNQLKFDTYNSGFFT